MADWNDVQSAMEWLRLYHPDPAAELLVKHMQLQSSDPDLDCQDCMVAESAVRGIVRQGEHILEVFCRSEHSYRAWQESPTTDYYANAIKGELLASAHTVARARQILERLLLLGDEAYDRMRSPKNYQPSNNGG